MASESRHPTPVPGPRPLGDEIVFVENDATDGRARGQAEIAMVLGPLLRRPGGLRDGSVYVLSMRALREFFGARWAGQAGRIYEVMESAIAAEIAHKDVYIRVGGDSYLIAFSREGDADAEQKAARIAKLVQHKLVGTASDIEIEIHALGHRAPVQDALAVATAGEPQPVFQANALPENLMETNASPEYVFIPIWDAYHKILSTYGCTAVGILRSGRMRFGHELLPAGASDMERAEFDVRTFNMVTEVADDLHRNRFAVIVTLAIDYASLGSLKSRERLVGAFRSLPKHLIPVVTVRIANAPEDVPPTTLSERIGLIKPYFRSVMLQIHNLDLDVQRFAYMGLHGLVYRFWDWNGKESMDFEKITHLIRHAKATRLQTSFGGVPDLKVAQKLADAGATYLFGPFLGAALDTPTNMRRCTLEDLRRKPGV